MSLERYINNPAAELDFDLVEALGLDGTGRDGDDRFPYTWGNLTDAERGTVQAFDRAFAVYA